MLSKIQIMYHQKPTFKRLRIVCYSVNGQEKIIRNLIYDSWFLKFCFHDIYPQLLLFERSWMSRWKSSVLHEGEGNIRSVKWRGHLIAWANNMVQAVSLTLVQSQKDSQTESPATKGRDGAPATAISLGFVISPYLLPLFFF